MVDFGWSYPPGCSGTPYDDDDFSFVADVVNEITLRNEGRNLNCFPVISFGWKDADLDPDGCTGIKCVLDEGNGWSCSEDWIDFVVGGHKTVCFVQPDEMITEDAAECANCCIVELVQPYQAWGCEADIEDVTFWFEETIRVPVVLDEELGDVDINATAEKAIEMAQDAIRPFEDLMRKNHECADRAYEDAITMSGYEKCYACGGRGVRVTGFCDVCNGYRYIR